MAVGAVNALNKLNVNVPNRVSVMSMDGFNLAEIHDVPLTAVHVPRDELGQRLSNCYSGGYYARMHRLATYYCRVSWWFASVKAGQSE